MTTKSTCPLCSSKNNSLFHKDHLRKYLQCLNCEFVFVPSQYHLSDSEEKITVDANHPLAGETLHFSVKIEDIRDAEAEELSHGHVHSAGGHSH